MVGFLLFAFFLSLDLTSAWSQFGLSADEHDQVNDLFGLGKNDKLLLAQDQTHDNEEGQVVYVFNHVYRGYPVYSSEAEVVELESGEWWPYNTTSLVLNMDWYARSLSFEPEKQPDASESIKNCQKYAAGFQNFRPIHGANYKRYLYLHQRRASAVNQQPRPTIFGPLVFLDMVQIYGANTEDKNFYFHCHFDATLRQIITSMDNFQVVA